MLEERKATQQVPLLSWQKVGVSSYTTISCSAAEVSMSKQMRFCLLAPAALISIVPFASFAGMSRERDTSTATLTSPFATGHFRPSQVMVPTPSGNLMTLEEQTSPE